MSQGGDGETQIATSASSAPTIQPVGLNHQKLTNHPTISSSSARAVLSAAGLSMPPPVQQVPAPCHVGGDGMECRLVQRMNRHPEPGAKLILKSLI